MTSQDAINDTTAKTPTRKSIAIILSVAALSILGNFALGNTTSALTWLGLYLSCFMPPMFQSKRVILSLFGAGICVLFTVIGIYLNQAPHNHSTTLEYAQIVLVIVMIFCSAGATFGVLKARKLQAAAKSE